MNAYAKRHVELLESIGNLAAIALDNAALYEETVEKSEEILYRNKELDDFTYVVSHDLKEPLISIEGFGKILLTDFQSSLSAEAQEHLHSIVAASGRMKNLINDLLLLSRLGNIVESFTEVNMV